jgi:Spy/CpxP family protein refolding chaperone
MQVAPAHGASDFIIEQLKLDEKQQQQFFELRRQHQDITRQIREKDRKLHDQYFDLLKTDNPDKTKADSISLLIGQQRSRVEAATFDHFQQLRNLCRVDQKKIFDNTIDEIMRLMAPKGPGHGGPPPPER